MKPRIPLKEAKSLSAHKWNLIYKNGGSYRDKDGKLIYDRPKLLPVHSSCGFCHRWMNDTVDNEEKYITDCECGSCEFAKAMGTFCNDSSMKNREANIYRQWIDTQYDRTQLANPQAKELAYKILKLIRSIPETEE